MPDAAAVAAGFHMISRIGICRSCFINTDTVNKQQVLKSRTRIRIGSPTNLPTYKITASAAGSRRKQQQEKQKQGKSSRSSRRLVRISTGEGRWNERWSCDYLFTFRDLQLEDLIQDGQEDNATVSVKLWVDKHASFGFSVEGTIVASLARKCSNCSSPYWTQIDTNVNVWVLPLPSTRQRHDNRGSVGVPLPVIGGDDDPSVIYVKPGHEANLDSIIQDALRLALSVKDRSDTCSERCDQMQPQFHYIEEKKDVGVDKRWSKLLQLKKQINT